MIDSLRLLREVTTRLRRIPGGILALEPLRRGFARTPRARIVQDFDGTLLEVRLDEHMGSHIFWYGSYSREILLVLDRILRPGMVVFDVGANLGEVAIFAAKRVAPGGKVVCFEPLSKLAGVLRENIARNPGIQVEVVECGVADRIGSAPLFTLSGRFQREGDHAGLATLYAQQGRETPGGTIPLTTLDHHCGASESRVDLIKVDVEGAELPVLQGAHDLIGRFRPWLILEVQRDTSEAAGYDQADILRFLEPLAYTFARIGRRGRLSTLTPAGLGDFQNVLCIPPGAHAPVR
jgi:FkbM family methyltransferase